MADKRRAYQSDIQNRGSQGRSEKMVAGIENSHAQSHTANEDDIGEADSDEINRHIELLDILGKTGSNCHGQRSGEQFGKQCDADQNDTEPDHGGTSHGLRGLFALFFHNPRIYRNKRHGQRTFAKQTAQEIRNTESHEKRIGKQSGTQRKGHDDISNKPQHAGKECRARHHGSIFSLCFFHAHSLISPFLRHFSNYLKFHSTNFLVFC